MAPDPNVLCPVACNMCPVGSSDSGNDGASGIGGAGGVKRNGTGVTGGNVLVVQAGATHVSTLVVPLPFLLSQQDLVSVSPPTPHTEMGNRTGSACALGHWHPLIGPSVCPAVVCVRLSPDTENSTESSLTFYVSVGFAQANKTIADSVKRQVNPAVAKLVAWPTKNSPKCPAVASFNGDLPARGETRWRHLFVPVLGRFSVCFPCTAIPPVST